MKGAKRRLFVVEDHPATARALTMYLESQGYTVTVAGSVASAMNVVEDAEFDLLICDLTLPDGTGWDLMKKISAKHPVRAIAYTASGAPDDIARSEKAGFIEHLVKGCSTEELMQTVEQALNASPKRLKSRSSTRG